MRASAAPLFKMFGGGWSGVAPWRRVLSPQAWTLNVSLLLAIVLPPVFLLSSSVAEPPRKAVTWSPPLCVNAPLLVTLGLASASVPPAFTPRELSDKSLFRPLAIRVPLSSPPVPVPSSTTSPAEVFFAPTSPVIFNPPARARLSSGPAFPDPAGELAGRAGTIDTPAMA